MIRENEVNVLCGYSDAYFCVGVNKATPYQLIFSKDGSQVECVCFDEDDFGKEIKEGSKEEGEQKEWEKTCGDGTVPFFSSSMGLRLCKDEKVRNRFRLYVKGEHVKLSSEADHLRDKRGNSILDNIVNILINGAMLPMENEDIGESRGGS